MKKWFNDHAELKEKWCLDSSLNIRYGPFPLFWQDLSEWKHWKEVDTEYSKSLLSNTVSESTLPKQSRWADASSRLSRSRWDCRRPFVPPGILCFIRNTKA